MPAVLRGGRALAATLGSIVLLATPGFAASGAPVLRSVTQVHRHVVVKFTDSDLQPWLIEVAVSRATDATGAFLSTNIRLRERITARPNPTTGLVRWRTRKALPPRVYYVEVSGIESGGVTQCPPQHHNCLVHWSTARRVRVR
jgi:hypothetical protein